MQRALQTHAQRATHQGQGSLAALEPLSIAHLGSEVENDQEVQRATENKGTAWGESRKDPGLKDAGKKREGIARGMRAILQSCASSVSVVLISPSRFPF